MPWQSISGLCWLFVGAFSAARSIRIDRSLVALLVAFLSARSSGMCWNRLVDWQIDAKNPRTATRALPSGRISPWELVLYAVLSLALFLASCLFFSSFGRLLGVAVACAILGYSFMKRFSILCHFFLGGIHGMLPVVGTFWQLGRVTGPSIALGAAAMAAVSGTDILYAVQDEEFDRKASLFSIPSRLGLPVAMEWSAFLHVLAIVLVSLVFYGLHISWPAYAVWGLFLAALLTAWRRLWQAGRSESSRLFPAMLLSFSVACLSALVVDQLWNT